MTDTPTERENEGAWAKLRRRKVVQWGLAYAAGAWVLLQGVALVRDTFGWSHTIQQVVMLLLLIGLPIALVLAWYHGDRGHQKPVRTELVIIAMLLLSGGAGLWLYQRSTDHAATPAITQTPPTADAPASADKTAASVAVLPFTNLSTDPGNEYLADGIAETMITMLAQVPQLLVIGKNSSFSYKGKDVDSRTIGQQLGVGALLEGSVQRAGDQLRVAVQLVSTSDGHHLWAETYDRPTTDVFVVQDDIAKRVTEALSVALAGKTGPASIGTTNVAAYDAYLRGKQLVERRETKVLEEGVALLEKAVAADPNFARAWVKLSEAYYFSSRNEGFNTIGRMPSAQAFALSERAARRAVSAAPNYGAAHAALGSALAVQAKDGYSDEYERAISLGPDDPEVIGDYALYLSVKDTRKALKIFEPLLAREPRDPRLRVAYAGLLDSNGDIDAALAQYREAIGIKADYVRPYDRAADTVYQMVGLGDLSLRLTRRAATLDPDNPDRFYDMAGIYWNWGETDRFHEAQQALRRLGAKRELLKLERDIAIATSRTEDARRALTELLVDAPGDFFALQALTRLRGTKDDYEAELRKITDTLDRYDPDRRTGALSDATICLHAWLDHQKEAADELAHWEPIWRSRHAFGFNSGRARNEFLARSLACVGRNDDALTELEALLNEGYNIGWRDMAVDPAYDAIRSDPRFKAVSDKLKAADAAAKARFRARPDLNDADIDSLGSDSIGVKR